MSQIITLRVGPLATAAADAVATSQTLLAAGNLTLDGTLVTSGVAYMDTPRRLIITSAGNDTAITFTAYGTDYNGSPLEASHAGGSGSAVDFGVSFRTVTRIAASGATAAAVTAGTNTVADSRIGFLDQFGFAPTALQLDVTGTVNVTVQQTLDNPNGDFGFGTPLGAANINWHDHGDSNMVAATASAQSNYAFTPVAVRLVLNSGTGSAALKLVQLASPAI
jgi:hypothetical protein